VFIHGAFVAMPAKKLNHPKAQGYNRLAIETVALSKSFVKEACNVFHGSGFFHQVQAKVCKLI
jgi:hypothetical protein